MNNNPFNFENKETQEMFNDLFGKKKKNETVAEEMARLVAEIRVGLEKVFGKR